MILINKFNEFFRDLPDFRAGESWLDKRAHLETQICHRIQGLQDRMERGSESYCRISTSFNVDVDAFSAIEETRKFP